jgi:N-acyl-D-amino-acid deacylase
MYDVLIVGGEVVDGSGTPSRRADIGIVNGKIAGIGNLAREGGKQTIVAEGRVVSPGFIDLHAHDDFNLPVNPLQAGKVFQGVTTDVVGNCGFSPAPIVAERRKLAEELWSFVDSGLDTSWSTFGEFLDRMPPTGPNVVPLVGHLAVRVGAMGADDRAPTPSELEHMRGLVDEAMRAGAFGLSTGLIYPPACYAKTDEIIEVTKVAARYGGGYFTHMRNEGEAIMDSLAEAVEIGKKSGAPVQISHLKVANKGNWGRAKEVLAYIDKQRAKGLTLHADQYPYTAASTGLKTLLPQWAHNGGARALVARLQDPSTRARIRDEVVSSMGAGSIRIGTWDDALISDSQQKPELSGLTLTQAAQKLDRQPVEALFDILIADQASTLGIFFSMAEDDLRDIMRHPAVGIGSDGIFLGVPGKPDRSKPHPRYFGTFPRIVGKYTRDEGVLTLPQAVHKMTGLSAKILGLKDRGLIRGGMAGDVVIFNPQTVADTATFAEPHQQPRGIDTVIVNGVVTVHEGKMTGSTGGKVLRRTTPVGR